MAEPTAFLPNSVSRSGIGQNVSARKVFFFGPLEICARCPHMENQTVTEPKNV